MIAVCVRLARHTQIRDWIHASVTEGFRFIAGVSARRFQGIKGWHELAKAAVPPFRLVSRPATARAGSRSLEPIQNLISPEPLEAVQRLVQRRELVGINAADLLDRTDVLLIQRVHDVAHLPSLLGELDAHRTAI